MFRRALLRASAATLAVGLAGCGGGDAGSGDGDGTPTPAGSSGTQSPTPASTPESTPASTPAPTTDEPGVTEGTATSTATATQSGGTATRTPTATATASPTSTPLQADQVVEVGPDGDQFAFAPDAFEIAAGDTVAWVWRSGGHNVRIESAPGGSDWSGTPGGSGDTYDAGYTHAHTFEATGEYAYYCAPHRSLGMTGSFTVSE